jgi:hypothetical protein
VSCEKKEKDIWGERLACFRWRRKGHIDVSELEAIYKRRIPVTEAWGADGGWCGIS